METEEEVGNLPTRSLVRFVERYKPVFITKIARSRELITALNADSSIIRVERATNETRKAEIMGEELQIHFGKKSMDGG